jgi:carbon storage regulator
MLLLSRKQGESICIADNIEVRVLHVHKGKVKLGIEVPRDVPIRRKELYDRSSVDEAEHTYPAESRGTVPGG